MAIYAVGAHVTEHVAGRQGRTRRIQEHIGAADRIGARRTDVVVVRGGVSETRHPSAPHHPRHERSGPRLVDHETTAAQSRISRIGACIGAIAGASRGRPFQQSGIAPVHRDLPPRRAAALQSQALAFGHEAAGQATIAGDERTPPTLVLVAGSGRDARSDLRIRLAGPQQRALIGGEHAARERQQAPPDQSTQHMHPFNLPRRTRRNRHIRGMRDPAGKPDNGDQRPAAFRGIASPVHRIAAGARAAARLCQAAA